MLTQVILGAVGGLAYSLSGLAKKDSRETFDFKKMAPTIIVGAIVGGISGYAGMDLSAAQNTAWSGFVTAIVENGWKAFSRKVLKSGQ